MGWWERRKRFGKNNRGLLISPTLRMDWPTTCQNLVLLAPTRAGKTTGYVIPNVLQAEASLVVTDPAGEIFQRTAPQLRRRRFEIQALRPADLKKSAHFNPLTFWRTRQELRQLATILVANVEGKSASNFWALKATNLLYLLLCAISSLSDPEHVTLANTRSLLNRLGGEDKTADAFLRRQLGKIDRELLEEYRAFCGNDPRVKASILATASAALDLWSDPTICELTSSNTIDLDSLRERRTAIFLIVPEHQVRYYSVLLSLFYSACFARCLRMPKPQEEYVLFLLDEFGNMGKLPDFENVITTLGKRRCSISLILQDFSQVRAVYGHDRAKTILSGGCANKLFLGGLDVEECRYVEALLGTRTEYDSPFAGVTDRARAVAVPPLRAEEVRMLRLGAGVLVSGRWRGVRVQ